MCVQTIYRVRSEEITLKSKVDNFDKTSKDLKNLEILKRGWTFLDQCYLATWGDATTSISHTKFDSFNLGLSFGVFVCFYS